MFFVDTAEAHRAAIETFLGAEIEAGNVRVNADGSHTWIIDTERAAWPILTEDDAAIMLERNEEERLVGEWLDRIAQAQLEEAAELAEQEALEVATDPNAFEGSDCECNASNDFECAACVLEDSGYEPMSNRQYDEMVARVLAARERGEYGV